MGCVHKPLFLRVLFLCIFLPGSLASQEEPEYPNGEPKPKLFEWSSHLQLRYTGIEDVDDLYALRRFKVVLRGSVKPHIKYYVQGIFKDGNESNTDNHPYLQETWIGYTSWKYGEVTVGQFKPPFGMERLTPDWKLVRFDRSQATDHLVPGGQLGSSFTCG